MPAERQRAPARRVSRASPRQPLDTLKERVIAQEHNPESTFVVPLPEPEEAVEKTPDLMAVQEGSDTGEGQVITKVEEAEVPAADESAERAELLAQEEAAAQRVAEEQARRALALQAEETARRLAAEHEAQQKQLAEQQALLAQQRAAEEQARVQAQRQAAEEDSRRLAQQQFAAEQARQQREAEAALARERAAVEEKARLLAQRREEQLRQEAMELAARRQAEEEARRQAMLRQRELEELAARQAAERLALQRQAEEASRREAAELAARKQADLLAQQRAADQLAERRRAEELAQLQAEEEARQRVEQAARRAAELAAIEQRGRANERSAGLDPVGTQRSPAGGLGAGGAGGGGALPRNMLGGDLANRARELVRGIGIPGSVPPAARPAIEEQLARRRAVSWGPERDVPLRLYIDSFRQKIERNATLSGSQLGAGRVRIDPLVSVAIRSDGSVEDVTIVRSSGRADTDEAVRRIVALNARYSAFPPNVAARFDVIEIRRIWSFAQGLKLLEELR